VRLLSQHFRKTRTDSGFDLARGDAWSIRRRRRNWAIRCVCFTNHTDQKSVLWVLSQMLLWTSQLWKRCEFRSLCHQCSCLSSGLYVTNAPTCSLKDLFSDVLRETHQNSLFSLPTLCHQCSLGWKTEVWIEMIPESLHPLAPCSVNP
jgi:hypothetical protein